MNSPLLAVALLLACAAASTPTVIQREGPRFLALGDSYTIGERVDSASRWPVQLAAALRARGVAIDDPEIIARTGWTTSELAAGIDRADPKGPFALVTLLIGVNNQFRGRDAAEYDTQFRALLDRAIGFAGNDPRRVVVVSIPDWGATPFAEGRDREKIGREIDAFNAIAKRATIERLAHFVDITPESRNAATDPELVAPDGLHPSAKMYGAWVGVMIGEVFGAVEKGS
ncbi:MAG: SGNH/GDSL hydrolase family protein [Gemmatimonadota bacterium]|nr:SGNH/GDSL hydrolase family protein [Gemmatimonadota bacterium]